MSYFLITFLFVLKFDLLCIFLFLIKMICKNIQYHFVFFILYNIITDNIIQYNITMITRPTLLTNPNPKTTTTINNNKLLNTS